MASEKKYRVTKRHIELFKRRVKYWLDRFGINEYQLYFEVEDVESAYGACIADLPGMVATIVLAEQWDEEITDEGIESTARHEAIELLMQPLWHATLCRELNIDWANSQRHTIIRRLERVLDP